MSDKSSDNIQDYQKQTLEMLRAQQEAYLEAVKAWRDAAAAGAPPPKWPEVDGLDPLPSAGEMAEASYAFAARLLADQSRFMEELSKAITNPKKS